MPLILQDVVRVDRALGQPVARAHLAALLHVEVRALRDQVLLRLAVLAADHDLAHAAGDAAELARAPSISATMAASFGRRASNSSATRGRPPVMSRILLPSRRILASTSPAPTGCPSRTSRRAPVGSG